MNTSYISVCVESAPSFENHAVLSSYYKENPEILTMHLNFTVS